MGDNEKKNTQIIIFYDIEIWYYKVLKNQWIFYFNDFLALVYWAAWVYLFNLINDGIQW
jgi:hypothetical protein